MGERLICNQEVTGSIPVGSTRSRPDRKAMRVLPSSLDGLLRGSIGSLQRLTSYREIHIGFVLTAPREGRSAGSSGGHGTFQVKYTNPHVREGMQLLFGRFGREGGKVMLLIRAVPSCGAAVRGSLSSSGSSQAREGRLVDALAVRGDEGRDTLR